MLVDQHFHRTAAIALPGVADDGRCVGRPAQRPFHAFEDVVVVDSKQCAVIRREVGQLGLDGSILLAVWLALLKIWHWLVDHVLVVEHEGQCAHSYADNYVQVHLEGLNPLDDSSLLCQFGHIWV